MKPKVLRRCRMSEVVGLRFRIISPKTNLNVWEVIGRNTNSTTGVGDWVSPRRVLFYAVNVDDDRKRINLLISPLKKRGKYDYTVANLSNHDAVFWREPMSTYNGRITHTRSDCLGSNMLLGMTS